MVRVVSTGSPAYTAVSSGSCGGAGVAGGSVAGGSVAGGSVAGGSVAVSAGSAVAAGDGDAARGALWQPGSAAAMSSVSSRHSVRVVCVRFMWASFA